MQNQTSISPEISAKRYAGLHLSGANAARSAVVVVCGKPLSEPLKLVAVYEKIGPLGKLFSDERLVNILKLSLPLHEVFVDSPLSAPPCVACTRPLCPGVEGCEDVAVAMMVALNEEKKRRGARKRRPINPQSQRLWDVCEDLYGIGGAIEPSYSANMAPLVVRARTLQRRLHHALPGVELKETSIDHTLRILGDELPIDKDIVKNYRNFERGLQARRLVMEALVAKGFLDEAAIGAELDDIVQHVEAFQAALCAMMGAWHAHGFSRPKPATYLSEEGWVYTPQFLCELEKPPSQAEDSAVQLRL